ncbi:PadR family transcriptional regulator [Acidaminococcus sp. LBK-2]|uniref:PadR family transcriptional regulator n=1 Tax=Acidaminococcus sp. LBK-2 TaxID=3456956 RepID=UPI003FA42F27
MAKENTLRYVLLGLLAKQDLTGYDIKKLFEQEVGDFWCARHSQVYPELRKLEESGQITSYTGTVGTKLQKKYYRLAPTGEKRLQEWLVQPLGDMMPTRDEFTMKLYLIRSRKDPQLRQLFQADIRRHEEHLAHLRLRWQLLFSTQKAQEKDWGHALILQEAIQRETQKLAWEKKQLAEI